MIPQRHPGATRYLGAPADHDPEKGSCAHLAIADIETSAGPAMQSIWEPTPGELAQLNAGGKVVLTVRGQGHPPVMIGTWLP